MRELVVLNGSEARVHASNGRDTSRPVVLIGFQQQGNLGIGYLTATLSRHGYHATAIDFQLDPADILERIRALNPMLVGFSLIFQFYIEEFGALIRYLRNHGVQCHFTIGGHFPSLSYRETLELIPEVDSVVRFEGEETLVELADCLSSGRPWQHTHGIAYRSESGIIAEPLRHLVEDLDSLPYPTRDFTPMAVLGHKIMPILASRGCARTCSFCSIHTFYRSAPGKVVRLRHPSAVVNEMKTLHEERDITIFLFQDDDFPLFGPSWRRWTMQLVDELYRQNLVGKVLWKINCRADAVDHDLFCRLRDAGLYIVYMGLESGSDDGLEVLNKEVTVEENIRAVETLKRLGVMFQYGFMLFDPSTTFESVRTNIAFLRHIVGDGSAAATFCRMLPYDGTPIKDELKRAGRLRGDVCNPDYDFLDPRLGGYFEALSGLLNVAGWIHGCRALSPQLDWAWHEVAILERLFPPLSDLDRYKQHLRTITRESNDMLFTVVEEMAQAHEQGTRETWSEDKIESQCQAFLHCLLFERNEFVYRHQEMLLQALAIKGEDSVPAEQSV